MDSALDSMAEVRESAEETAVRLHQATLQRGLLSEEAAAASGLGQIVKEKLSWLGKQIPVL